MGTYTRLGWLKADDEMFTGGYMISSHPASYKSEKSSQSGTDGETQEPQMPSSQPEEET